MKKIRIGILTIKIFVTKDFKSLAHNKLNLCIPKEDEKEFFF